MVTGVVVGFRLARYGSHKPDRRLEESYLRRGQLGPNPEPRSRRLGPLIGGPKKISKGVLTYRLIGVSVDLLAAKRATLSMTRRSQIRSIEPIGSTAMLSMRMLLRKLESI